MSEPIDPDVDVRRDPGVDPIWTLLLVIALGGGIGAVARYGIESAWPTPSGGFPWATFSINVIGCLLIGVLMVTITEAFEAHRLVRPLLGVGVLGGFTTFSTYAVETVVLTSDSRQLLGLAYLVATVVSALGAVIVAVVMTRTVLAGRIAERHGRS